MLPPCHLASRSPRRLDLLRAVGLDPRPCAVDVHEEREQGESPRAMVARLAEAKGRAALARLTGPSEGWLLAADTIVVIDGEVLGKPPDARAATAMLRRLAGRSHEVMTGVFVARVSDVAGARATVDVCSTAVRFRALDEPTIAAYVASGEPLDKAGAYGIQARGAMLVEAIDGSWTNVAGLPLERLPAWLEAIGFDALATLGWTAAPPPGA